ncbi:MAG: WecB/TagA/CpsF family glycosyltransferase [Planctomycetota bacterium]
MQILNCRFDEVDETQTIQWASKWFQSGKRGYITTVNVAITMMMRSDSLLRKFINNSALTVADGQPIIWLSRFLGNRLPGRIAGVDLVHSLSRCAADNHQSVYLMGAKKEIVDQVATQLKADIPHLKLAGVDDGYFGTDDFSTRASKIAASGAGLLIVAMGVPRQEQFLHQTWNQLGVKLAIGVGGSFDVIAGHTRRAPQWMQKTGLEWFYRMMQEPKRLFKRYLVTNTQFVWFAGHAVVRHWMKTMFSKASHSIATKQATKLD